MPCRKIWTCCLSVAVTYAGLSRACLWPQTADALQRQDAEIRRALEAQDGNSAERELRKMLLQQPSKVEARRSLGYVLFRQARPAESLEEYTRAAGLQTPSAGDMITVCSDYILLKDYADAEHWLLYTTQQFPGDARAWYLLGRTEYKLDHVADVDQKTLNIER